MVNLKKMRFCEIIRLSPQALQNREKTCKEKIETRECEMEKESIQRLRLFSFLFFFFFLSKLEIKASQCN